MDTLSFYYLIGGIVILHFLVGIVYLMYKMNKKPNPKNEEILEDETLENTKTDSFA